MVLCGACFFVFKRVSGKTEPPVYYAPVIRGDVALTVPATGVLQASRTVSVGTQVSGVVRKLYVDYNSIVRKGELIAEIDPALSEAALQSAQAALDRANIQLQAAEETLAIDTQNRDREDSLFEHSLATEQSRETADLQVESDDAVVEQDKAAIIVAQAGVDQAKVTLGYCTIRSPIDGVVVTRNADEGQTVASGFSVPSLFIIATDIETLELSGQVDESDIGKLHPGQPVTFTVDAYPGRTFRGTMTHVRLYATTTNNVVTYQAIVSAQNPDLKLLPSMTATMKVEVARASNAIRVPNAALRFRPSRDVFDAMNEAPLATTVPASMVVAGTAQAAKQAVLPLPAGFVQASSGHGVEIDQLFQPAPAPRMPSLLWVMRDGKLQSVPVTVGISDGQESEIVDGAVQPGDQFVTSITLPRKPGTTSASPLMPGRPGGPGPQLGRGAGS